MPKIKTQRFMVVARRKETNEKWTPWTATSDFQEAEKQRTYAIACGYESIIIDSSKEKHRSKESRLKQEFAREIFEELDRCCIRKVEWRGKIIFDKTEEYEAIKKRYIGDNT